MSVKTEAASTIANLALPPEDQCRTEQLIHAAFALGSDYERAMTSDDVRRIAEKLGAILGEARKAAI